MNKDEIDKLLRMVLKGKWDAGEMSKAAETWMGGSNPCSEVMLGDSKPAWTMGVDPAQDGGGGWRVTMEPVAAGEPVVCRGKKPYEMDDDQLDAALWEAALDAEARQEILDEVKLRAVKKGMEAGVEIGRQRAEKEAAERAAAMESEVAEAKRRAEVAEDMEKRVVEKAVQEMEKRRMEREKKEKEDEDANIFRRIAPPPSNPVPGIFPSPPKKWTKPMVGGEEEDWALKTIQGGMRE